MMETSPCADLLPKFWKFRRKISSEDHLHNQTSPSRIFISSFTFSRTTSTGIRDKGSSYIQIAVAAAQEGIHSSRTIQTMAMATGLFMAATTVPSSSSSLAKPRGELSQGTFSVSLKPKTPNSPYLLGFSYTNAFKDHFKISSAVQQMHRWI